MIYGLKLRWQMSYMLRRLQKAWGVDTVLSNQAIESLCKTDNDIKVLRALENCGCVKLSFPFGHSIPYSIKRGERSEIYLIERSELWANRVFSFIIGIASTLIVEAAIRALFLAQ